MVLSQALVQYPDDATAAMAKQSLDGYHMYPGGKNRVSNSGTGSTCVPCSRRQVTFCVCGFVTPFVILAMLFGTRLHARMHRASVQATRCSVVWPVQCRPTFF
jgi:hypothetical protein